MKVLFLQKHPLLVQMHLASFFAQIQPILVPTNFGAKASEFDASDILLDANMKQIR